MTGLQNTIIDYRLTDENDKAMVYYTNSPDDRVFYLSLFIAFASRIYYRVEVEVEVE